MQQRAAKNSVNRQWKINQIVETKAAQISAFYSDNHLHLGKIGKFELGT